MYFSTAADTTGEPAPISGRTAADARRWKFSCDPKFPALDVEIPNRRKCVRYSWAQIFTFRCIQDTGKNLRPWYRKVSWALLLHVHQLSAFAKVQQRRLHSLEKRVFCPTRNLLSILWEIQSSQCSQNWYFFRKQKYLAEQSFCS